jgi:hypothetical protein
VPKEKTPEGPNDDGDDDDGETMAETLAMMTLSGCI